MKHGRIPLGILSILIVLLLNLLAASPSLHERLHADAGQPGHQCAVTVFAHGKVDSVSVEVVAAIPVAPFEFRPLTYVSIFSTSAVLLPPGRAPPVSLLNS
ncbi:MAG TPA: hypothetical protein VFF11_14190 [Candidatus Binatia bacterium]|nr:hypothetical protein [Candidatus Binatia bacterium]